MRTPRRLAGAAAVVAMLGLAQSAEAAVSITRAELKGTELRIEGQGARPNAVVTETPGSLASTADGSGAFRIESKFFNAPADCMVKVSDGTSSATTTLSGCTKTAPAPTTVAAPGLLGPTAGATVAVPFDISWSAVSDPSGIAGYNWQVSRTSDFSAASVVIQNSTDGSTTHAPVSGLADGSYFWRVQAATGGGVQGAWSEVRSFTVSGAGANSPGSPVLDPAKGGTTLFHPLENISYTWSAATGAGSYVLEASKDPSFPFDGKIVFDNIRATSHGFAFGGSLQGTWFIRVYAVNTTFGKVGDTVGGVDVIAGRPSNTISVSVQYTNPTGPPPALLAPASGATAALPVTLSWADGYNPQDLGYQLEVSQSSTFSDCEPLQISCEFSNNTATSRTLTSLAPGTWFWRVRSAQGDSSPTTPALTAWSPTRSFTVESTAPKVQSVDLANSSPFSGQEFTGRVQLTNVAPPGGLVVSLASSDPGALSVPPSVTVDAGQALSNQITVRAGQVIAPTPVTVTATLGSSSATFSLTVQPPSLKRLSISPTSITGGASATGMADLNGLAPAGGAPITLTSDNPAVTVPAIATAAAGTPTAFFSIDTSVVTATTTATVTATWKGVSQQALLTVTPGIPPDSLTLDPTTTTGTNGSTGRVALNSVPGADVQFTLTSSNPAVARVPQSVTIPAFAAAAQFSIATTAVTTSTPVTISASGGGVTKSAVLTVQPTPSGPLPAPSLISPSSGARFAVGRPVTFDWSDVTGAAGYTLQVSRSSAFSSTVLNQGTTASQFTTSTLPKADLFWRVRAVDSAASPGAWSAVRGFRVK